MREEGGGSFAIWKSGPKITGSLYVASGTGNGSMGEKAMCNGLTNGLCSIGTDDAHTRTSSTAKP